MKFLLSVFSACALLTPFASPVSAYSQDPRSCSDPRTQYPSNPPCQKQQNLSNVYDNRVNY